MPSGRIKSGKTTMQDIADKLNISKVSVSKALNNQKGVSEELRMQIIALAAKMGYQSQYPKTQERLRFAFTVSKYFFLDTDAFYSEMFYYFNKYCVSNGHSVVLMIVNAADQRQGRLPPQFSQDKFDGIAVAGEMPGHFLKKLAELNLPMVLMDFESDAVSCNMLLTDNYYWGYNATNYLIKKGHSKIGFVGPVGFTESITDRYFGYRRALMLSGLKHDKNWILVNNDTTSGLYQTHITLPAEMPTAFVCHCDMAAHYLLRTLETAGLSCPEDISLVSFDNTKLAQITTPPLTTVNINVGLFARHAMELLCQSYQNSSLEGMRVYMPSNLVENQSVKALAGQSTAD